MKTFWELNTSQMTIINKSILIANIRGCSLYYIKVIKWYSFHIFGVFFLFADMWEDNNISWKIKLFGYSYRLRQCFLFLNWFKFQIRQTLMSSVRESPNLWSWHLVKKKMLLLLSHSFLFHGPVSHSGQRVPTISGGCTSVKTVFPFVLLVF